MNRTAIESVARPRTLTESVKVSIRRYITQNRLQPGDPLPPETELAAQLGVSRNSVREAVKALESLGILEVRRGTGLFVSAFSLEPLLDNLPYALMADLQDLVEIFEVRHVLESSMIEKALALVDEQQLRQLREVVDRMGAKARRGETFAEEDQRFHRLFFEKVENKTMLKLLDIFWLVFRHADDRADLRDIKRRRPTAATPRFWRPLWRAMSKACARR